MPKNQKILDDFYYKTRIIINDPYFQKSVSFLLEKLKKFNIAVPDNGFDNDEECKKWREKYWNKFDEIANSKEYKEQLKKITKNKRSYDSKTKEKVDELRERMFPPVYKNYIDKIIGYYNIDKKYHKKFKEFVLNYIFFKRDDFPHTNFSIKFERNKKTGEIELYVRIFGYTTKKDITKNWSIIEKEKKLLKDYHGKNKEKESFERDLEIYKLYKELKKDRKTKKGKGYNIYNEKRLDEEIWNIIHDKYNDLEWENIRKIISKMNKLDEKFVTDK